MTKQDLLNLIEKKASELLNSVSGIVAKYWDNEIFESLDCRVFEDIDVYPFIYGNKKLREEVSNIKCSCGCTNFEINLLVCKYMGGFLKVTCSHCGNSKVLLDDYA